MTEHERTTSSTTTASVPLDPTGIPGLDEILGGGIQRGSLVILAGPPGSGKTILAHHIAFIAARTGRHTTILTAFSEPTNKLIAHMRPFAFFDQELLGQTLDVLSIQQFLRQGLEAAGDQIVATVRASKARLVTLDGFRGVRETAERPDEARRFIYDLSNRLSLFGITLMLTSEAHVRDSSFFPEATTADVLLGLAFDAIGARERRTLEVLKVRGAAPMSGLHALTIGDDGVTIYPRLEARVAHVAGSNRPLRSRRPALASAAQPPADGTTRHGKADREARATTSTGVPGLDALLDGGLARDTSTLVVGERGAGKTLLGLQFAAEGARSGEPGIYVSFRETAEHLSRKAAPFTWGAHLQDVLDDGMLTVMRMPPVELQPDVLAGNLLALVDETRASRLVLDEIGEIERALTGTGFPQRYHDFVAALLEALRLRNVTSLLTHQLAEDQVSALEQRLGSAGALAHNLVWLRRVRGENGFRREIAVLQTSLARHAGAWYPLTIQPPEGIIVDDSSTGGDAVATASSSPTNVSEERANDDE